MQKSTDQLLQAAQQIAQARLVGGVPIDHLPEELAPVDIREAMALQNAVHARLATAGLGIEIGTKIGCTTQVMQEYLGMQHPCAGAIFSSTLQHQAGEFEFARFLRVGVECEIAAVLNKPLLCEQAPHTLESVRGAVQSVHAAIEIVDDRYQDFANRVPDWKTWVADDFFGAGVVLGPAIEDWQQIDLASIAGSMHINGHEVGRGHGRDIINQHPLEALVWLANFYAELQRDLPADWLVMLGSVVQTKWLQPGDRVEIEIERLGKASAHFVA